MMSLIAAKSDYIIKADLVYENLKESEECFRKEAVVLDYFKCMRARGAEIEDFYADGIYVDVRLIEQGYELSFDEYRMRVSVYEKMIVDFVTER